jgi:hypothetical protein
LGCGWGGAAGNQSFDGYDHGKGLDLAGDGASGYFVAEIDEFPEPGQDLVATKVRRNDWSLAGAQFGELVVRKHSTTVAIAGLTAYRNLDE